MSTISNLSRHYTETENMHYEKRKKRPLSAEEKSIAVAAYERGYRDALHTALAAVTYSEKNIIERLKDLEK